MLTTTGGMAPTLKFLRLCGFVIEFWVEILYAGDLRLGVTAQAAPLLFSRKAELSKQNPAPVPHPFPSYSPPILLFSAGTKVSNSRQALVAEPLY